jgi:hypothetical protein
MVNKTNNNKEGKRDFTFYKNSTYIVNRYGVDAACVHGVIWNRSKTEGFVCELSYQTIGNLLHISYKRVRKAVDILQRDGFIVCVPSTKNYMTIAYKYVPEKAEIFLDENEMVTLKCNDNRKKEHKESKYKQVNKIDGTNHPTQSDNNNLEEVGQFVPKGGINNPNNEQIDGTNPPLIKKSLKELIKKNEVFEDTVETPNKTSSIYSLTVKQLRDKIFDLIVIARENQKNKNEFFKSIEKNVPDGNFELGNCEDKELLIKFINDAESYIQTNGLKHRTDEIKARIKGLVEKKYYINCVSKKWDDFIDYAYRQEINKNYKIERFIEYLEETDYERKYVSPDKFMERYPQAFIHPSGFKEDFCAPLPPRTPEKDIAPMPKGLGRKRHLGLEDEEIEPTSQ